MVPNIPICITTCQNMVSPICALKSHFQHKGILTGGYLSFKVWNVFYDIMEREPQGPVGFKIYFGDHSNDN